MKLNSERTMLRERPTIMIHFYYVCFSCTVFLQLIYFIANATLTISHLLLGIYIAINRKILRSL